MPENRSFENTENIEIRVLENCNTRNVTETNSCEIESQTQNKQQTSESRDTWTNEIHFLMTCIAMSVGLGNVWRFPFTAYENGGGAFLIPYLIVLVLVGRPIYYMEMCLGQFTGKGNVRTLEALAPALKGVGIGQLFACTCVTTYYCSLLALTLFYLFNSFTDDLPWSHCKSEWKQDNVNCISSDSAKHENASSNGTATSADLWFTKEVLNEKTYIDDGIGWPEWKLTIFLFLSWLVVFVVSAKGVRSTGKASYFLALFPYAIMIPLLARAVTLDGSATGIIYFLKPQWEKLLSAKVWYNAVTQCFFSLNIGSGAIIMFSSYNNFKHNIYRDALIITSLDTCTSLISGITIFGILGNSAHVLGVDVTQVISSGGTRLAFVSYPDAISKFSVVPWLFSILFFLMLFVLGIGSLVAGQGCIFTEVKDSFPYLKHWHLSLGIAVVGFLIGLLYITPGGQFILIIVDYFGATFLLFILTTVEVFSVFWWYGLDNFLQDVEFMLNRKMGMYWKVCWGICTPVVLAAILSYFLATLERPKNGIYEFPDVAISIGWCLLAVGLSQPFIWWLIYLLKQRQIGILKAILKSFNNATWGPRNPKIYEDWRTYKSKKNRIARFHLHARRKQYDEIKSLLFL